MSSSKVRPVIWAAWLIASIFYAYQYVLRVMPNIMLEDIMGQFHVNAAAFGQFSGIYYIGYSLMHLPIGLMLDRYGPRVVMSGCILLSTAGLLPLAFSEHWAYPVIGRLLTGIGSSSAILGVFKIVRMTFSEERFSRMLSFSVMIGLLGAIYGGGPVSYMHEVFGYQTLIRLFGVLGVVLAIVAFWIVPSMKSVPGNTVLSDIKEVLTNRRVVGSCLCAGLMVGPLEGFADVWGTAFLKRVYGFEGSAAASLPSMIFVGMCFGAPMLSFIAEKVKSELMTIVGAGIVMAVCFFSLLTLQLTTSLLGLNFVVIGVCCAYQILAIYKASTYVREQVAGLTTAVANMIIMIFGYGFHTAMGGIVNALGGPGTSKALLCGVIVVPGALCLGTLGFFYLFMKERRMREFEQVY